jgi:hypothetical protein
MRRKFKLNVYRDISGSLSIHGRLELLVRQMLPTINMVDLGTICCVLQKAIKNNDLKNTGVSLYEIRRDLIGVGYRREVVRDALEPLEFMWSLRTILYAHGEKRHQIGKEEIRSPVLYLTTLGRLLGRKYIEGAEVGCKDVRRRVRIVLGLKPYG